MRAYVREEGQPHQPQPHQPQPHQPLRSFERERPPIQHGSVHISREAAETRVDAHPQINPSHVFNPTSLEAPPPRSGFKQRWVADGTNPVSDKSEQRNWFSKMRMGWQIRDPETVPPQLRYLYPSTKLHDGQTAVRIAGMVLCEMPIQVAREYSEAIKDRIQHQKRAVPDALNEKLKNIRAREQNPAIGELEVQDAQRSWRGRRAPTNTD